MVGTERTQHIIRAEADVGEKGMSSTSRARRARKNAVLLP